MAEEYRLSYTGQQVDEAIGKALSVNGIGVIITSPSTTLTSEQVAILEQYEERTILILHEQSSGNEEYTYLQCLGKEISNNDTYYHFRNVVYYDTEVNHYEHTYLIRNHVNERVIFGDNSVRTLCLHSIEYDTDKYVSIISASGEPIDPLNFVSSFTRVLNSAASLKIKLGTQTEIWKQVINVYYASQTEIACVYYDESTQSLATEVIALANLTNDIVSAL